METPQLAVLSLLSVRTVACFGQCALAPVVEVNHAIYGHMNEQALRREIQILKDGRR